jgi:hypothetical protein
MMKDGTPAYSNFDIAGYLTEIILLGCIACASAKACRMEWDGPNMKSPNCPEAAQFVKRDDRGRVRPSRRASRELRRRGSQGPRMKSESIMSFAKKMGLYSICTESTEQIAAWEAAATGVRCARGLPRTRRLDVQAGLQGLESALHPRCRRKPRSPRRSLRRPRSLVHLASQARGMPAHSQRPHHRRASQGQGRQRARLRSSWPERGWSMSPPVSTN